MCNCVGKLPVEIFVISFVQENWDLPLSRGIDKFSLLAEFNFTSLASRRRFHNVIYLLKLLCNIVDSQFLLSRVSLAVSQRISQANTVSYFYLPVTHNSCIYKVPMYVVCKIANDKFCNFPCDLFFDSFVITDASRLWLMRLSLLITYSYLYYFSFYFIFVLYFLF